MKARRRFNFWYFIHHDLNRVAMYLVFGIASFFGMLCGYNLATNVNPLIDIFPFFMTIAILGMVIGAGYTVYSFWKVFKILRRSGK
ncbi:MAG: hypothetical protein KGZ71_09900 [Desulfobulbaceae bacterium]|nr:hypothetical protein [Desulfobulbaceae bacterium]